MISQYVHTFTKTPSWYIPSQRRHPSFYFYKDNPIMLTVTNINSPVFTFTKKTSKCLPSQRKPQSVYLHKDDLFMTGFQKELPVGLSLNNTVQWVLCLLCRAYTLFCESQCLPYAEHIFVSIRSFFILLLYISEIPSFPFKLCLKSWTNKYSHFKIRKWHLWYSFQNMYDSQHCGDSCLCLYSICHEMIK